LLVLGVQRPPFFDAAPAADDAVHHVGRPRPLAGRNGPLGRLQLGRQRMSHRFLGADNPVHAGETEPRQNPQTVKDEIAHIAPHAGGAPFCASALSWQNSRPCVSSAAYSTSPGRRAPKRASSLRSHCSSRPMRRRFCTSTWPSTTRGVGSPSYFVSRPRSSGLTGRFCDLGTTLSWPLVSSTPNSTSCTLGQPMTRSCSSRSLMV